MDLSFKHRNIKYGFWFIRLAVQMLMKLTFMLIFLVISEGGVQLGIVYRYTVATQIMFIGM